MEKQKAPPWWTLEQEAQDWWLVGAVGTCHGEMRDQTNEDSHGVLRTASMDQSGSHCEASSGWASPN